MAVDKNILVGTWALKDWSISYSDGREASHPFGARPKGLLIYTAEGLMSACIAKRDRPAYSSTNPRKAPVEEKVLALETFFSYAGRFEIKGDTVLHYVDLSLNQNFIGSVQQRRIVLQGDDLDLLAEEKDRQTDLVRTHRMSWRRATRGEGLDPILD